MKTILAMMEQGKAFEFLMGLVTGFAAVATGRGSQLVAVGDTERCWHFGRTR